MFHRSRVFIEKELSDVQKKKVQMLTDKFLDLNIFELRYFQQLQKEKLLKTSGMNPMKINLDWPSVKQDGK
jgi:hypothetical protein